MTRKNCVCSVHSHFLKKIFSAHSQLVELACVEHADREKNVCFNSLQTLFKHIKLRHHVTLDYTLVYIYSFIKY